MIPNTTQAWTDLLSNASYRGLRINHYSKKSNVNCTYNSTTDSLTFSYTKTDGSLRSQSISFGKIVEASESCSLWRWLIILFQSSQTENEHLQRMTNMAQSIMKGPATIVQPTSSAGTTSFTYKTTSGTGNVSPAAAKAIDIIRNRRGLVKILDDFTHFIKQLCNLNDPSVRTRPDNPNRPFLRNKDKLKEQGRLEKLRRDGTWERVNNSANVNVDTLATSTTLLSELGIAPLFTGSKPGSPAPGPDRFVIGVMADAGECRMAEHGIYYRDGYTIYQPWLKEEGKPTDLSDDQMQYFLDSEVESIEVLKIWTNVRTEADIQKLPEKLRDKFPKEVLKQDLPAPYSEVYTHISKVKAVVIRTPQAFARENSYAKLYSICERLKLEKALGIDYLPILVLNDVKKYEPPTEFTLAEQKDYLEKNWLQIREDFARVWANDRLISGDSSLPLNFRNLPIADLETAFGIKLDIDNDWLESHGIPY